jgi:hypothetical protein
MSYFEIYKKRANRYGIDYQSRIQGEREHLFDLYLVKSIYRVDFLWGDNYIPGSFEKYKQDETETLHYLLTKVDIEIPNGTILMIPDKHNVLKPWMVYYLEHIKASGYNRYVMLKMTHCIHWTSREGDKIFSWAYMYGQENNMLKDEIRSRSRMDTIYAENLKSSFFVLPKNKDLKKDDYLIIGEEPFQEYYRVTGYDIQSSEGVEYVTVDPVYEFDLTPAPEKQETDSAEDWFWLEGGSN